MNHDMRWLVVDVIPAPTHLGLPPAVVMGTAMMLPDNVLLVKLAQGGSHRLPVNPRNAAALAKLVLRALARRHQCPYLGAL